MRTLIELIPNHPVPAWIDTKRTRLYLVDDFGNAVPLAFGKPLLDTWAWNLCGRMTVEH